MLNKSTKLFDNYVSNYLTSYGSPYLTFDTDTENMVPGQLLPSELESNKIQDVGGRHMKNHIFDVMLTLVYL